MLVQHNESDKNMILFLTKVNGSYIQALGHFSFPLNVPNLKPSILFRLELHSREGMNSAPFQLIHYSLYISSGEIKEWNFI